jgi:hypothetical protein
MLDQLELADRLYVGCHGDRLDRAPGRVYHHEPGVEIERPWDHARLRSPRQSLKALRCRRRAHHSASTPAMPLSPTSIICQAMPAWKGSPAWNRIGTEKPSTFLPSRQTGEVPTL